jgi:hypothetical protein
MDLEVREVILAEEMERDKHYPNGWDLLVELDKARAHIERIDTERATKGE